MTSLALRFDHDRQNLNGRAGNIIEAIVSRTLIVIGIAIAAVGVLWPWIARSGLGRLPGDIVIHRGNFTFYAPITTCILVSLALSLVFWLLSR